MEVVYRLWEESWEDGAVVRDRAAGVFADPAKVHRITHAGRHYHRRDPRSRRPSGRPLFQARSSRAGQRFARHAECVFVTGNGPHATATAVAQLRGHRGSWP